MRLHELFKEEILVSYSTFGPLDKSLFVFKTFWGLISLVKIPGVGGHQPLTPLEEGLFW